MFVNAPLEPATRTKPVVSGDLASLLQNSAGPAHARSGAENMEKTVGWVILVASLFLFAAASLPLRANISETLPVVVINEQGEEEKDKDEQEFSWCCLRGWGWRGTKRRRAEQAAEQGSARSRRSF